MFKKITKYRLKVLDWIGVAFAQLPVNAFIDKGRCAIGGTTIEVKDKSRISIITVSNISILISKKEGKEDERPDYIIYGDIKYPAVLEIMRKVKHGDKIMTTPEGLRKIMKGAKEAGRLEEVYNEWFLLLDECHTFITEDYREDILAPFDYFWNFKKKSIISATPYYFTDERFYDLHLHKITFDKEINTIELIRATSVEATLNFLLLNADHFPGNLHIFYNSVTAIVAAIRRANLSDCNIYCADNKDNFETMADLQKFHCLQPRADNYKKVNFYSSRHFEGWDLWDKHPTVILVTDFRKAHTAIGIGNKGKQAVGRPRDPIHKIIHITNHECKAKRLKLEDYKRMHLDDAGILIADHNKNIGILQVEKFRQNPTLKYFADIDKISKIATLNYNKLDQQIHDSACRQGYNHIRFIIEDWQKAYFKVVLRHYTKKLDSATALKRKSFSARLKEDYYTISEYHSNNQMFYLSKTPEEVIKEQNPTAYNAYHKLDEQFMIKVKFNFKTVEQELITRSNANVTYKMTQLIKRDFSSSNWWFNSEITSKLQNIYNKVGFIDEVTGKVRVAEPIQLGEPGRFITRKSRRKNSKGIKENGFWIDGEKLALKVTE